MNGPLQRPEDVSSSAKSAFQSVRAHRGLAVVDLDNDGKLDAVVSVLGDAPEIWHNTTVTANHWIAFRLKGRSSNGNGMGAEIRLKKQMDTLSTSFSYASTVLAPLHFGLGAVNSVDRVFILWPSGKKQTLTNVRADQIVTVTEP